MDEENIPGVAQVGLVKVNLYAEEKAQLKADIEKLQAERDDYRETLQWLAQTVHQAHHEGNLETCLKNTCSAAISALKRWEGK